MARLASVQTVLPVLHKTQNLRTIIITPQIDHQITIIVVTRAIDRLITTVAILIDRLITKTKKALLIDLQTIVVIPRADHLATVVTATVVTDLLITKIRRVQLVSLPIVAVILAHAEATRVTQVQVHRAAEQLHVAALHQRMKRKTRKAAHVQAKHRPTRIKVALEDNKTEIR